MGILQNAAASAMVSNDIRLTIGQEILQKSLSHVQNIVEKRNTIPVLSNVLLTIHDGKLRITATDMDLSIDELIETQVSQEGSVTAPAHMLYEIVKKLPSGVDITLESQSDSSQLIVSSGKSKFTLPCLPVSDFPVISEGDLPSKFEITIDSLLSLVDKTRFAISTEETRYYLNGIYLHIANDDDKKLRAVSTDGHRLARAEVAVPQGAETMPGIILPRKTVLELRKLLEGVEGNVKIELSDTRIKFSFLDIVLTSKLIDGKFPDYEKVIPQGNDKRLEIERDFFAKAVDRVSTISTEKSRGVKLEFAEGKLNLSANSPETGFAHEEIAVDYTGQNLEIGFNARYLLDIMQQVTGDKVVFVMKDPETPTIVQDTEESESLYVLMPMRV